MPKMKSHGGTKKRFKISASGKVIRGHAFRDHLKSHKDSAQKRNLKGDVQVSKADAKGIKRQIPYL